MSSGKGNLIQKALDEFPAALKSALPLDHFSQFYDEPHLDKTAKQISKKVLMNVQASSELEVEETVAVASELLPKFQDVIRGWKAKNEENKTKCNHFLQTQNDFLLSDFRTSVMIKLISAPDVGLQELETFLEQRKIMLINIFDKLSKPGEPQSSVQAKIRLDEMLEGVKLETLDGQRLEFERKQNEKSRRVLEDSNRIILKRARQLKSELKDYHWNDPKELVKATLVEINKYLSIEGKELEEYHSNIYSAVQRTIGEVKKCLDEEDYEDMSAEEFAETLHEQFLFDFAVENLDLENSSEINSGSISFGGRSSSGILRNEKASLTVRQQNEICPSNENEAHHQCEQNDFQIGFVEEDGVKEENDKDEVDRDSWENFPRDPNYEAGVIQSEDDGGNSEEEEEEENEMAESRKSPEENLERDCGKPYNFRKHVSKTTRRNSHRNNRSRRSARVPNSSKPVAVKRSTRERRCVVVQTKKPMDGDECSGSGSEDYKDSTTDDSDAGQTDLLPQKRLSVRFNKPTGSKSRQTGKRRLSNHVSDNPKTEKITYLHLDKNGRPIYRCNVCNRKCRQYNLKYHGEHCGKSDDPFACKECGKAHMNKANLDAHVRIHTGEKPFKCSKCPERFSVKNNLTRHLRSHLRGTRFFCKACKLGFISHNRLHDHNKSMHKGKLPFGCRYCDERFASIPMLKNHVVSHAGLRPLRCPTCDFVTCRKYDLVEHIRAVHSQSRQTANKLANEAAIAYLVGDTKDDSYRHMPERKINSLVLSHIIKKANLKLPKGGATRTRKSADYPSTP